MQTRAPCGTLHIVGRCHGRLLEKRFQHSTHTRSLSDSDPSFIVSDRGRHPGFSSLNVCAGGLGSLSLSFALDPKTDAAYPPADRSVGHISDLLSQGLTELISETAQH